MSTSKGRRNLPGVKTGNKGLRPSVVPHNPPVPTVVQDQRETAEGMIPAVVKKLTRPPAKITPPAPRPATREEAEAERIRMEHVNDPFREEDAEEVETEVMSAPPPAPQSDPFLNVEEIEDEGEEEPAMPSDEDPEVEAVKEVIIPVKQPPRRLPLPQRGAPASSGRKGGPVTTCANCPAAYFPDGLAGSGVHPGQCRYAPALDGAGSMSGRWPNIVDTDWCYTGRNMMQVTYY